MSKGNMNLNPSLSLSEIYGHQQILIPRPSSSHFGWLIHNQAFHDFSTGAPLSVAGDMPVVCSHYVSNDEVLELLQMAGLTLTPNRYIYHSPDEFTEIMDRLQQQAHSLVFNHLFPREEVSDRGYWISPKLFALLNNKAYMHQVVPPRNLPRRMVIRPSQISQLSYRDLPLVLKIGSEKPTGGGRGLLICTRMEHLYWASRFFVEESQSVVIEEFLRVKKNYCVQFAKTIKGEIRYLGTTEQITNTAGIYIGNWLGRDVQPPKEVIILGRKIMEKACSLGYQGIAGFDIVTTKDHRVLAIDLNFRLNASTPSLLLQNSILDQRGSSTMLFRYWSTVIPFERVYTVCKKAIADGYFIPLFFYNPILSTTPEAVTHFSGLLLGSSRKEITDRVSPMFQRYLK